MPGGTHEILIIESDQPTAELYQWELSREYRVFTCTDERTAFDRLRSRMISAVVLEPALDGGQGWRLFAAIKAAYGAHSIPIILCSTLDERGRGMGLGAAAYLVKPALPTPPPKEVRRGQRPLRTSPSIMMMPHMRVRTFIFEEVPVG